MASFTTNFVSTNRRLILSLAFLVFYIGLLARASPVNRVPICSKCSDADRARCPVVVPGPECEVVEEPNCGCCKMCAKKLGEKCGVAIGYCESGLECIPPPITQEEYEANGPADYFMEALLGDFVCVTRQQFLDILSGVAYDDNYGNDNDVYVPELYDPSTDLPPSDEADTTTSDENSENNAENYPDDENSPFIPNLEPVPATPRPENPLSAPYQNTLEPCIYHAGKVWAKAYFDHHEWIPSCEKDGFYYPEQCELSFGLERGRCWCVDRMGNPVSGFTPGEVARPELCFGQNSNT